MTPTSVQPQTDTDTKTHSNLFLAALPPKEVAQLAPFLRHADLSQGQVVFESGERLTDVLFVESGMVSLLTPMQDGSAVETATLGREAVLGALAALGLHTVHVRAVVQVAGSGYRMRASDFRVATEKSRLLRQLVMLSSELTLAQTQQTAACNAVHSAERRLCRWILQVRDRVDGDVIELTHDFLAQMLAVRRPTVSLIARQLQDAGLIRYRRGRITIVDREGLERMACECVDALRTKTRLVLSSLV